MKNKPLVSIILLNWNQPHFTLACLHSLNKITYPNFNVIVVDNGSVDDSISQMDAVKSELNYKLEIIANDKNLGFAEGNNVGIRRGLELKADYVLLLNNDTEVAPGFLEPLVQMNESNHKIGITGPKIYYYDQPDLIWSAGGIFTKEGWTQQLGVNQPDSPELNKLRKVDYVSGCAMLVKRSVIEKVGMLDPRFFIYYEETDWCGRTAKGGFEIWYVPESILWHKISLKARDLSPRYIYLMTRNRLLFLRNMGFNRLQVLKSIALVDLRTVVAWTLWKRHKEARPLRRWRLQGVMHYLQGKFGEPLVLTAVKK
jgi:GT2 family glycosyltransferase